MSKLTVGAFQELMDLLSKIPGGYCYMGVVSDQVCFPLKSGGELRFSVYENDDIEGGLEFSIDLYDGSLPPGITGPATVTGSQ